MKVLVLGSKGMAGHLIRSYLKSQEGWIIHDLDRSHDHFESTYYQDITNWNSLEQIVAYGDYDVVINCIAILNQLAEEHQKKAIEINALLPQFLKQQAEALGFKVIQLSTDGVFAGSETVYDEHSAKSPVGVYAESKSLGELGWSKHLTVRMSIIGPSLQQSGIFNWFLSQDESVSGYANVIWSGVTTLELAKFLVHAIVKDISGIYHLAPKQPITKFQLLEHMSNEFRNKTVKVLPKDEPVLKRVLISSREDVDYAVPSFDIMLAELKNWMIQCRSNYLHLEY